MHPQAQLHVHEEMTVPDPAVDDPCWRKSSHSNPNGECVQLAELPRRQVAVRCSREPGRGSLIFTRGEMIAFLRGVKDGEFDDLMR